MLCRKSLLHITILSAITLSTSCAVAQPANDLDAALARVQAGTYSEADIDLVAPSASGRLIPILEAQFAQTDDAQKKTKAAFALVKLHDRDNKYWDYLATAAASAIESDVPYPLQEGPQGKSQISPAFTAWVATHDIAQEDAYENAVITGPAKVIILGQTEDQRAVPILRQALLSPNPGIQAAGAKGLAQLHDIASISMIIAACQSAPAWAAPSIADALVYFDDPQAQRAAEKYLPPQMLENRREAVRAHGNKPFSQHP